MKVEDFIDKEFDKEYNYKITIQRLAESWYKSITGKEYRGKNKVK